MLVRWEGGHKDAETWSTKPSIAVRTFSGSVFGRSNDIWSVLRLSVYL